jgi:tRNA modification GTPase
MSSETCKSAMTWVARLTPAVPSAIATVAVRGPSALKVVTGLVRLKNPAGDPWPLNRVRYGLWNAADQSDAAEQVVVCRTREDVVEIHCHGGNAVCQMIEQDLVACGCIRVAAGEFPGELLGEIEQEAAIDLQRATTNRGAAILLDQLNGALSDAIASIAERWRSEGAGAVRSEVQRLLRWSELGSHLADPWQVVLAGPPNVGKSSLVNAIAGSQRAIVHSEPGTTRDWVEVFTAIDGWSVALSDTAGVRDSVDAIESEGIRRALERVAAADLVVLVVDATVGWTASHASLQAAALNKRTLTVWNKMDLQTAGIAPPPVAAVCTNANRAGGVSELLSAIAQALVPEAPPPAAAVPFRERHLRLLESFLEP